MIDWQSYLDNSMDPADRAHADQLLLSDPEARQDLAGLQALIAETRRLALAEPIPTQRLETMLRDVTRPKKASSPRRWQLALASCLALFAFAMAFNQFVLDPDRVSLIWWPRESAQIQDVEQAKQWVQDRTNLFTPTLMFPNAELLEASHRDDWAKYRLRFQNQEFQVIVARDTDQRIAGTTVMLKSGRKAKISINGITWHQSDYRIYITGPKGETLLKLANNVSLTLAGEPCD